MSIIPNQIKSRLSLLTIVPIVGFSLMSGGSVFALSTASTTPESAKGSTTLQQADLNNLKTKGTAEINRRLASLDSALSLLASTPKLSSNDKSYLTNEVNTEVSGLTTLRTQLNSETTLTAARTDVQSIYSDYRVYALILPKLRLIETADNQLNLESKLTTLASQLQTDITTDNTAGQDVASLQMTLDDMTTQISNAQSISSSIESTVLTLQPTNYDSNHSVLAGDLTQLKTAHSDIVAAYNDGKTITTGLKSL